jgi:hypothetical protein
MDLVGIVFDSTMPKAIQAVEANGVWWSKKSLMQTVSVPMPEAIQAVKQVEVVFSG